MHIKDTENTILNIEDVDGNSYYDVNDFLEMNNKEILDMNDNKKWDIVLMNPPYDKNLHIKFMKKCLDIIDENYGNLIYIGPDNWLINKYAYAEKSNIKNKTRDKYCKYIDSIETFTADEFNQYFSTSNWFGVSIFKMNYNAKGIDPKQFESNDKLIKKIIQIIQEKFTSLRSHFTKRSNEKYFVPVRRTNHGYLNWVEKDQSKNKAKDGILFNSENEMNNFIDSFDTWLYKFLNCTDWLGSENSADVPYLNDYSEKWTNEKLYKIFNISKDEQKFIENEIKKKNPWK